MPERQGATPPGPPGEPIEAQAGWPADDQPKKLEMLPPAAVADAATSPVQQVSFQESRDSQPSPAPLASGLPEGAARVESLVAYALANNPEVAAARNSAQAMMARVPQAVALEDPSLMATVFLEEVQTAAGAQELLLSLSQKLPWFGKRTLRGEVAYHAARAAYSQWMNRQLDVALQVKLAYLDLYYLDRALEINHELRLRLEDVLAIIRTRFETGTPDVGLETVLQTEIAISQLDIDRVEIERGRVEALARLRRALPLPADAPLDIIPQLDHPDLARLDVLLDLVHQCHPQLELHRQEILRDRAATALAWREFYPDAVVGFNWIAISERGLSPVRNGRDAYSAMIGINIPLQRERRWAALRQAQFELASSQRELAASIDQLQSQIVSYYAEARQNEQILELLDEELLEKSEQTLDLAIEAYQLGRVDYEQMMDSYEDLLRYRLSHHLRLAQRAQSIAQLEYVIGCAITEWATE